MKNEQSYLAHNESTACLHLDTISRKIRRASEPNNPSLLTHLFSIEASHPSHSALDARLRWITQYWLLLETIEDASLPAPWREHCLNAIHFPLNRLKELVDGGQSRRYVKSLELRIKRLTEIYS